MTKVLKNLRNSILLVLLSVSVAFADPTNNVTLYAKGPANTPGSIADFACIVVKLALDFVPYLVLIAVADFLMGLVKYVGHGDDEEKRGEGIKMMIYGILGLFFMVSVWGIMRLAGNGFGLNLAIPQFNSNGTNFAGTCS